MTKLWPLCLVVLTATSLHAASPKPIDYGKNATAAKLCPNDPYVEHDLEIENAELFFSLLSDADGTNRIYKTNSSESLPFELLATIEDKKTFFPLALSSLCCPFMPLRQLFYDSQKHIGVSPEQYIQKHKRLDIKRPEVNIFLGSASNESWNLAANKRYARLVKQMQDKRNFDYIDVFTPVHGCQIARARNKFTILKTVAKMSASLSRESKRACLLSVAAIAVGYSNQEAIYRLASGNAKDVSTISSVKSMLHFGNKAQLLSDFARIGLRAGDHFCDVRRSFFENTKYLCKHYQLLIGNGKKNENEVDNSLRRICPKMNIELSSEAMP